MHAYLKNKIICCFARGIWCFWKKLSISSRQFDS